MSSFIIDERTLCRSSTAYSGIVIPKAYCALAAGSWSRLVLECCKRALWRQTWTIAQLNQLWLDISALVVNSFLCYTPPMITYFEISDVNKSRTRARGEGLFPAADWVADHRTGQTNKYKFRWWTNKRLPWAGHKWDLQVKYVRLRNITCRIRHCLRNPQRV